MPICGIVIECATHKGPHRLTARTAGSHPANRSSILRGVTHRDFVRSQTRTGARRKGKNNGATIYLVCAPVT